MQLHEPSITVQHHDAPSLVVQQHDGPPYFVAEQQQGASYHSPTAYEDHSAVVHENDLRKNGNYRMAGGRFENPDYEGTPGDDADFIDANETTPFDPTSSSTLAPLSDGDIEMIVRHLERGGRPETSYAETSFGGDVTTEGIERRLNALRKPTTGLA